MNIFLGLEIASICYHTFNLNSKKEPKMGSLSNVGRGGLYFPPPRYIILSNKYIERKKERKKYVDCKLMNVKLFKVIG